VSFDQTRDGSYQGNGAKSLLSSISNLNSTNEPLGLYRHLYSWGFERAGGEERFQDETERHSDDRDIAGVPLSKRDRD
jgi:hypothetical protein